MKPIEVEEFRIAVQKAIVRIGNHQSSLQQIEFLKELKLNSKTPDKLTVPTTSGFLFINMDDILYCHATGNYTEFYLDGRQKIISSYTLAYYDELLANHKFFRVHRSYLVNLSHIKMYKKGDGGSLVMNNGDEIEVSRANKENFLKILKL
jgi:two-component system LytT family response regulator